MKSSSSLSIFGPITVDFSEDEQLNAINAVDFNVSTLVSAFAITVSFRNYVGCSSLIRAIPPATNHYIINMLRRISDDLELHPMLYQNSNQENGEIGVSHAKAWIRRSITDALGDDEADVVITHDLRYQNDVEKLDVVDGFASTSGNKNGKDDNSGKQLLEDESGTGIAPRRKKKLIFAGELEKQINDLYEKFKDDRHCSRHIAEVLDPDEAQGVTNNDSVDLEGNLLVPHLQKRKRVCAFNEDQEALIKVLYEKFKDHKRCSYMIANALDMDG
ncbi:hypothetical protein RIF29_20860 [Crotalaria pallida]|uniref:Uncharacterized protein n=1 Tax=Crotalaria pallida TaxID=3830 RepID=A0AAN9F6E1_CROPI